MMTPDAGLKSTPSTSKPSEEDAQPHDDDEASASGSVDLGFDSESGQTNDLKIGINSFPA